MKPKKLLSFILATVMTISLLPTFKITASATTTTTEKNITLGSSALHNADKTNAKWDYVYYGTYSGNPIKWRVLSTEGNSTTVGTNTDTATYKTADGSTYTDNALFMMCLWEKILTSCLTPILTKYPNMQSKLCSMRSVAA